VGLSAVLNQNSIKLDILRAKFDELFIFSQRGNELIKIIREYFNTLKFEIYNLKEAVLTQEKDIKKISERLSGLNEALKGIDKTIQEIDVHANLFLKSEQFLVDLAKNVSIRAYKARKEGRGFSIIAKESMKLSSLAQQPFKNFADTLQNLREIAEPISQELNAVVGVSSHSSILLSQTLESLKTIDEVVSSLEGIIRKISEASVTYNTFKKYIDEGIPILKTELLESLNTIDNLSILCAQINSFSQILKTLEEILDLKSNGRKAYIHRQFNYLLSEDVKVLDRFAIKKEPPLFPEMVYKKITETVGIVNTLNVSINELMHFSNTLEAKITEIANLQSQIESFFKKFEKLSKRLQGLADELHTEFLKMETLLVQTGKIFSKIKTLTVYVKMEYVRAKADIQIFGPIVEEYVKIEKDISQAFKTIEAKLPYLKRLLMGLIKEDTINRTPIKSPNYSKLKIFLDDIIRVFNSEKRCIDEIQKIAKQLEENNVILSQAWQAYETPLVQILKDREVFNNLLKEKEYPVGIIEEKNIIRTALSDDPLTLKPDLKTDANSHQVINNFSVGLFQIGEGVDVFPALCEDYEISADGKEYIFKIKTGIKYHNGARLCIEDIKKSFMMALSGPNFNFFEMIKGAHEFNKTKDKTVLGIEIIDDQTLKIELAYPFLPLLANLATNIADPYIDAELPIGVGPFKIKDYKKGEIIILETFDDYFEGRPAIDEFHFLISDNEEDKYELFKKGVLSIYQPPPNEIERIKIEYPGMLHTTAELSVQYLCINCQKPPFDNKLIRKALALAIDTNKLVNNFLKGNAIVAKGIFPPSMKVYNKNLIGYRYNPGEARRLLAEAGYSKGLPDTYPLDISDSATVIKRADFIKESLAKIGVKIEINPIPWHNLLEKTYHGESILSFQGWVSDNGDPDNFLYPLFHSNSYGLPGNTFFFSRSDIDEEIENARRCRNMAQRLILYQEIEKKILDESPGVFLFHSLQNIAIQKEILGMKAHALGLIRGKYIYSVKDNMKQIFK